MNIFTAGTKAEASKINENFQQVKVPTDYGDGSDGDVTISSNTSLTRDMFYNNLTINTGVTLNPNGFKIFVKGLLTRVGTGKIACNGNNGGTPTGGVAPYTIGNLPIPIAGANGGTAKPPTGAGNAGDNGTSQAKALADQNGANGGRGGDSYASNYPGGAGGTGGSKTGTINRSPRSFFNSNDLFDIDYSTGTITVFKVAPSGAGGGSGGAQSGNTSGAGGGAGSSGGIVFVCAFEIDEIEIEAKGGNGGQGGNSTGGYAGVGGGGAGGCGGVIILIYGKATNITTDVSGGSGGAIGSSGVTTGATAGQDGNDGVVIELTS